MAGAVPRIVKRTFQTALVWGERGRVGGSRLVPSFQREGRALRQRAGRLAAVLTMVLVRSCLRGSGSSPFPVCVLMWFLPAAAAIYEELMPRLSSAAAWAGDRLRESQRQQQAQQQEKLRQAEAGGGPSDCSGSSGSDTDADVRSASRW